MAFDKILTKLKSQSGRTMTEILGVIAIIGVLSLTGLLGFNYAMEVVRENETLNRASKIIAGARTSYILQNHGDATKYYQPGDTLPSGAQVGDLRNEYQSQPINMHDVISNIGNDFSSDNTYIIAPLKGPIKDGTEQNVKIYVRVETPQAFTVRFDNLTKQACVKIVMAQNLGYSWAYESADGTTHWLDPTTVMNEANAEALCDRVIGIEPAKTAFARQLFLNNPFVKQAVAQTSDNSGTLVLWFGPYTTMDGEEGEYPLCAGEGCCCELDDGGNLYPVGKAGCKKPPYGSCVSCTYENSDGKCVQKDGVTCSADDVCHVSKCNSLQFECGDTCCAKGQTCNDGECEGEPDAGICLEGQTQCGDNCCNTGEICNAEGECISDPCPKSEGCFWCVQGEVCCKANEKCQNGTCIKTCPTNETSCGEDCCPEGYECKESCGEFTCVPKCADGETLYCSHDSFFNDDGGCEFGSYICQNGTCKYDEHNCKIYHSCCDEWSCTKAPLILKDTNEIPRALEVPVEQADKYPYCALVLNNKCALKTYCDEAPISLINGLELCPSCFENNWSSKDFSPLKHVCIGKELHEIDTLTDGENVLMMFRCDGENVPPFGAPLPLICPDGQSPVRGGGCCAGTPWGPCGHCGGWATTTNACGWTYAVADICCAGETDAPPRCVGLGHGQCYAHYPIDAHQMCCEYACVTETGKEVCCDADNSVGGVCCSIEPPLTKACCDLKEGVWCAGSEISTCCTEGETCVDGQCSESTNDQKCEEAGGVPGYDSVPESSQVKDKDGNVIEGCCMEEYACPGECCKQGNKCV